MKIYLVPVSIDLVGVTCFRRLHRRTSLGASCLDIDVDWDLVGCNHVFYLSVWFQRDHCEALLAVTIMWHDSRSMVKSASGECHGSRDLRAGIVGSCLCGEVELAW
jgi:hypothetical protein